MPLTPPILDSRTFEQLVIELRKRIPTLTPEWTDLNEADPGITLAQLFAFMTEQLLFQVNQVPDRGLRTFLQMVGAELHPATPAIADVTFTNISLSVLDPFIPIDAGARVTTAAPPPGEKVPVAFETSRPFNLVNGSLADLLTRDCDGDFRSHAAANDSLTATFSPLDDAATGREAFYLALELTDPTADWPAGPFRLRVNVAGSTEVGEPPPTPASERDTPPRLVWSYASGSEVGPGGVRLITFTPIVPADDSTRALTRSGYLELGFDADGTFRRAPADVQPEELRDRFVLRAQPLRPDAYDGEPPRLQTVRLNTVPAIHLTTILGERLGASSGRPFQRFQLASAPVYPGSVQIELDEAAEGGGPMAYTEVQDIFAAGPGDRVFQLIPATGILIFGDGTFGKLPPPDDGNDPAGNVTATRYQFGGGLRGNVGAETITRVTATTVDVRLDATNVLPARGGDDEEPVDLGVARAPAVVRSRYRAVSATDFEALARETPDVRVARALALPNTRPGWTPGRTCGAVTVILVPNAPFATTIHEPILAAEHVRRAVLRFLDTRRLLTTQVFTASATYRRIATDVTLRVAPGASIARARAAALERIQRYLHALVGGDDGHGWPFGGTVYFSRMFEQLLDVPGVARVDELRIGIDGGDPVACADVPIRPGELLVSGAHRVRAGAGG
jgi:predicted phage baseplate assembly protein